MKTTDNTEKELLTIEEIAEILGVHKSWVYSRTKLGQKGIPHLRIGKYLRFQKDMVLDFLKQQASL